MRKSTISNHQIHSKTRGTAHIAIFNWTPCELSTWTFRKVYPKLAHVGGQLVDALKLLGDKEPVDMSLACMCETIDALGLTGFDKPYHNINCFKEGQPAHMLNVRPPFAVIWLQLVWS